MSGLCLVVSAYLVGAAALTTYSAIKVRARPDARAWLDEDERATFFALLGIAIILWPVILSAALTVVWAERRRP